MRKATLLTDAARRSRRMSFMQKAVITRLEAR
jgi:hypothetical protein